MIDYLNFIDELKVIKTSMESKTKTMKEIDKTISKYESRVSEFELEMAPKDNFSTEINQIADSVSQNA